MLGQMSVGFDERDMYEEGMQQQDGMQQSTCNMQHKDMPYMQHHDMNDMYLDEDTFESQHEVSTRTIAEDNNEQYLQDKDSEQGRDVEDHKVDNFKAVKKEGVSQSP
jgi:hypothetical protein